MILRRTRRAARSAFPEVVTPAEQARLVNRFRPLLARMRRDGTYLRPRGASSAWSASEPVFD